MVASRPVARAGAGPVPPGLRHNRSFRRIWFGQAVALVGDEIFGTVVLLWVGIVIADGRSWGPLAVGGTQIASSVPIILFGLVGGVYADRWDRRRTMLAIDAMRVVMLVGLSVFAATGSGSPTGVQLGVAYGAVALDSAAAQFFNPARFGLIGAVVADTDRERASSMIQGSASFATIAGPPVAAPVLVAAGAAWALLITATTYAFSFAALRSARTPPPEPVPPAEFGAAGERRARMTLRDITLGLRFFVAHRQLRIVLITLAVVAIGAGPVGALNAFFVIGNLHASAEVFGIMATAMGLGAVIGAVVAAVVAPRLRATRVFALGMIATGVGVAGYARMTSLPPALVLLFLLGIPLAAANSMIGPLVLRATPPAMLGRVIAVLQPAGHLAVMLSVTLATWLASTVLRDLDVTVAGLHYGPIDTVLFGGGLLMVGGGIWAAVAMRETADALPPAEAAI